MSSAESSHVGGFFSRSGCAVKLREVWTMVKAAATSWLDDYAPSMGAALSYYTVFSIAPLLLIVISVAGLVFGKDAARGEILTQLHGLLGEQGAQAVQSLLESLNKPTQGTVATVVGVVLLLVGATTVFGELQDALDRIWRAPAREKSGGILGLLRSRFLSFGMILGLGFLMMVSLVLSAGLAALGKWWGGFFGHWTWIAQILNVVVSLGLSTVVFALIYKIMPRVSIEWRDVWIGSAVTSVMFTLGKFLIGLYIGRSGVASGYGAAGSFAVLLLWVYYSAQIFFMGAEFTWVFAHAVGSRKGTDLPAAGSTAPARGEAKSPPRALATEHAA